jgi:hypothetical protein
MTTSARAAARRGSAAGPSGEVTSRADSIWWLVAVAAAFSLLQLVFVAPHLLLSWDEVVYVSQVSSHAPAAYFDPARARGVPLLVAPVAMLTSSVLALRIYLSVLSGLGLFLALLAWRGLRPAWVLALAGIFYGGLWVSLYYGPQAMPDEWVAFCGLAAVGLFVRAASRGFRGSSPGSTPRGFRGSSPGSTPRGFGGSSPGSTPRGFRGSSPGSTPRGSAAGGQQPSPAWWPLTGLAVAVAIAALVRPGDAVFLGAALVLAVLAVPGWRQWRLAAAVVVGFAAGSVEWVVEAYLRFGGPFARLHAAGAEQGGFGLHFALWDEFRAVNGPTLCRPCTVGVRYPVISIWWLALPVIVGLGLLVARRSGWFGSAALAACCGLAIAFQYLFLINYAAPRFLLPAYALLAIPVADAMSWLVNGVRADLRPGVLALLGVVLFGQLFVQYTVLEHQVNEKIGYFGDYTRIAADLHKLGVSGKCLVKGEQYIPIAYYAGCQSAPAGASAPAGTRVAVLEFPGTSPPSYARHWQVHTLPGVKSKLLKFVAYVSPGS